jgi:hypothetical protein
MADTAPDTRPSPTEVISANIPPQVRLPLFGAVALPSPERVAYLAGLGLLAAAEIIDWPLAVVIAAGHLLADQQRSRLLRGLGEAFGQA